MKEQERRQEILKAEETIRQLASEMSRASEGAAQAEAAKNSLNEARIILEQTVDDLQNVIAAQKVITGDASMVLNQASKSLEEAAESVVDCRNKSKLLISLVLENATTNLLDASEHIERIESHIMEAINDFNSSFKDVLKTDALQGRSYSP